MLPITQSHDNQKTPSTLHDAFEHWKTLPRHDGKGGTNGDRSQPDQLNYKRALRDLTLGLAGHDDLTKAPLSLLALEEARVTTAVLKGARQRVTSELKPHLASSLQSWVRALRRDLQPLLNLQEHAPKPWRELIVRAPSKLPPFKREQWPPSLAAEFEDFAAAVGDKSYMGPRWRQFNKRKVRPETLRGYRYGLHRYLEFCLEVERLTDLTLLVLVDHERVETFTYWYLRRKARGGYDTIRKVCFSLAIIARYLEIKGLLKSGFEPYSKHPDAPWMRF